MASCCVTPDSLPDIYNRILTLNDQNQTPIKLGKRSSRVKEKDSYCLCCGTNLHGVGSTYNTKTCNGLAGKVSKLLNCELDFNRQSCRVCKTCFRRVESLDKRVSVLYDDLEEFKRKFHRKKSCSSNKENIGNACHKDKTVVKRMAKEAKTSNKRKRLRMCDKLMPSSAESEEEFVLAESIDHVHNFEEINWKVNYFVLKCKLFLNLHGVNLPILMPFYFEIIQETSDSEDFFTHAAAESTAQHKPTVIVQNTQNCQIDSEQAFSVEV